MITTLRGAMQRPDTLEPPHTRAGRHAGTTTRPSADARPARGSGTHEPIVGPVHRLRAAPWRDASPGSGMTGDTVLYRGLQRRSWRSRRQPCTTSREVALVHIGAVMDLADLGHRPLVPGRRWMPQPPSRTASEPGAACEARGPVHVEGWSHFSAGGGGALFDAAAASVRDRIRWLPLGEAVEVVMTVADARELRDPPLRLRERPVAADRLGARLCEEPRTMTDTPCPPSRPTKSVFEQKAVRLAKRERLIAERADAAGGAYPVGVPITDTIPAGARRVRRPRGRRRRPA